MFGKLKGPASWVLLVTVILFAHSCALERDQRDLPAHASHRHA